VLKSFAGGRLFGGSWGSGAPATVLALHGWQRTHLDFSPVFGDSGNTSEVSVVGPDLSGFGATPPPPEAWGTDEYARQLVPLFDEPGVLADRIVVVGHSFGGRVAVRLHALVPGRIERMVLCGVPLLDRQGRRVRPAAAYRLVRRLHRVGLIGEERMEAARNRYGSPDYRAAEGVMREVFVKILAEQYAGELGSITCPVDLLWGEKDSEVPVEVARRAQGLFPEARMAVLPGIGHLLPTEAPRDLLAAVLRSTVGSNQDAADHDWPEPAIDEDPMAGSP
jgi:pimeloyl-ACP methyl ester carboxylesterase